MKIKKQDVFLGLGIFMIILMAGILNFRIDGDIMWHYKTGEHIVVNKAIPQGDIFSWQQSLNWMCHEWLYDIILFISYSNFGAFATRVVPMLALSIPILISFIYNRKKIRNPHLFLIFIIAVLTFWNNSNCARPSEFSTALILISAIFLINDLKYKDVVFFISCLLCANIHGGSIAGLLIIPILCMLAEVIVYAIKKEPIKFDTVKTLLIGFVGTLINPYGINIYKYTTNIFFGADFINSHILEWQPNKLSILTAVFLFGIALSLGTSRKFRTFEKKTIQKYILMFAFLCQGMDAKRMMFPAACFIMVFAYEYFETFIMNTFKKKTTGIPNVLFPIFALSIITLTCASVRSYEKTSYIDLVDEKHPEMTAMMTFMKENSIIGKVFTNYNIGGNLILHDIKTFIDPRCDPFIENFSDSTSLTDYFIYIDAEKKTRQEAWNILNTKYDFDYALLELDFKPDRELDEVLKKEKNKILYKNEKAVLYSLNEKAY